MFRLFSNSIILFNTSLSTVRSNFTYNPARYINLYILFVLKNVLYICARIKTEFDILNSPYNNSSQFYLFILENVHVYGKHLSAKIYHLIISSEISSIIINVESLFDCLALPKHNILNFILQNIPWVI